MLVQQSSPNVVDKKSPIGERPFNAVAHFSDSVKANPVRGNEIELFAEIGKGSVSFDPPDDSRNIK